MPRRPGRPRESARPPPSSTASASVNSAVTPSGNLLLVGLIDATGDLEESVRAVAQVDGGDRHHRAREPRGRRAGGDDRRGSTTRGQTEIVQAPRRSDAICLEPAHPAAPIAAVEAIERADVVVIGPGSLFTSVLAACVVPGHHPGARRHHAPRRSTSRTCAPRPPRPRASRSKTTSTRSSATASCSTWCWSTSARPSRTTVATLRREDRRTSRAKMASCTMCKNWPWPSSTKCDDRRPTSEGDASGNTGRN